MESPYDGGASAPVSHVSGSRPSIGFPLGTALLLLVVFSLSGVFSCCYHWDKLRRSFSLNPTDANEIPSKTKTHHKNQQENQGLPVIIMPGDNVPKFIALPCPCEPSRQEKIIVEVQKPPLLPPPKPPITCSNQQYHRDI